MVAMHLHEASQVKPPRKTSTDQRNSLECRKKRDSPELSSPSLGISLGRVSLVNEYQSNWRKLWLSLEWRKEALFRRLSGSRRHSAPSVVTYQHENDNNDCSTGATSKKPPPSSTRFRHSLFLSRSPLFRIDRKFRPSKQRMQIIDLPYALFLDTVTYLSPKDAVSCRRVSLSFNHLLTQDNINISLILHHFPRSREGRQLRQKKRESHRSPLEADKSWADLFALLARRYHHLGHAIPYRIRSIRPLKDTTRLRGVTPWNRFLRLNERTAPFHYWDPVWSFDEKDDLLVYPTEDWRYHIRDLNTEEESWVPFDMKGKIMRRTRLCDGILVFEWCEQESYHPQNERDNAHRHFATAFDVSRKETNISFCSSTGGDSGNGEDSKDWNITLRAEFKIHYLGIPLSHHDRFFSAHNRTHYAAYIWQPTRSPWGEGHPLERLIVWELGKPFSDRPSRDPTGQRSHRPGSGPHIILSLANNKLDDWGVRQGETPSLRGLALDDSTWDHNSRTVCGHIFITEEEHRWAAGPHSSHRAPRLHRVKSTGIPLTGLGPRHVDECGGEPDFDANMAFCWRRKSSDLALRARQRQNGRQEDEGIHLKNLWDPYDTWPGKAPCWRHDDFPYLTVAEVYDAKAGVRISARHCFMLETLSVHVRPRLKVESVMSGTGSVANGWTNRDSDDTLDESQEDGFGGDLLGGMNEWRPAGTKAEGPNGEEIQFADEMWGRLLGQGYICGNERWLIGEDRRGNITILEF